MDIGSDRSSEETIFIQISDPRSVNRPILFRGLPKRVCSLDQLLRLNDYSQPIKMFRKIFVGNRFFQTAGLIPDFAEFVNFKYLMILRGE